MKFRNNFNPLFFLAERKPESDTNLVNGQKGARYSFVHFYIDLKPVKASPKSKIINDNVIFEEFLMKSQRTIIGKSDGLYHGLRTPKEAFFH